MQRGWRLPGAGAVGPELDHRIPAWIFLGVWFLYQLVEASFGLYSASANGGGVAFFAHVGGFLFGWIVARALTGTGRIDAQQVPSGSRAQPAV